VKKEYEVEKKHNNQVGMAVDSDLDSLDYIKPSISNPAPYPAQKFEVKL
jgi:hypothetical protein